MACLLVSEVFDLLITDPNGYANMLPKKKSRVCISGNGEDTFNVIKSALFVEATCDDEGNYFPPLIFRELSYLYQLTIVNLFQLYLSFCAGFIFEPISFQPPPPPSDDSKNHGNCYRVPRF
jgi:hypothetical protein